MPRWSIAVLAAVVLAAAIALVVANRGGADLPPGATPADTTRAAANAPPAPPPPAPGSPAAIAAPRAAPPPSTAPPAADVADVAPDRELRDRDPRSRNARPHAFGPLGISTAALSHDFIAAVAREVAPIAQQCAAALPAAVRGADAAINVRLYVTIKGGALAIDGVDARAADISGDTAGVEDCARTHVASLVLDATGQPDVTHYAVTAPVRISR